MNGPARIAAFAAAVALVSGGAAVAGGAIDPKGADESAPASHDTGHGGRSGDDQMTATSTDGGGHSTPAGGDAGGDAVRGLAVADEGVRIVVDTPSIERGKDGEVRYRIVDERGDVVRDFEVTHEKRMHLILARRDLTGFQHLHPKQNADGSWSAAVRIDDAGSYRLFADFARRGEAQTLASDVSVDGPADLRPLPKQEPLARTDDGYEVRLAGGSARAGEEAELEFEISRNGETVHTEPYLGAGGHLVALREGDLAFLHVHPNEGDHGDEKGGEHSDAVGFMATFPTAGKYRLFLQFKHEGRVHTAAFTKEVK